MRPEVGLAKAAGLELGPRGGIKVDAHQRTSDPCIYAVGDGSGGQGGPGWGSVLQDGGLEQWSACMRSPPACPSAAEPFDSSPCPACRPCPTSPTGLGDWRADADSAGRPRQPPGPHRCRCNYGQVGGWGLGGQAEGGRHCCGQRVSAHLLPRPLPPAATAVCLHSHVLGLPRLPDPVQGAQHVQGHTGHRRGECVEVMLWLERVRGRCNAAVQAQGTTAQLKLRTVASPWPTHTGGSVWHDLCLHRRLGTHAEAGRNPA